MNKKVLWSILVILCLVLLIIFFTFLLKNINIVGVKLKNIPAQICKPYFNVSEAVKTGDLSGCNCLTDSLQKDQCIVNITNGTIYNKALETSNLSLCSNISLLDMKNACISMVQGKIDFASKQK